MIKKYKEFTFEFSIPPENNNKKYRVVIKDKNNVQKRTLYFGDKNYEQYFDKIGNYSQ